MVIPSYDYHPITPVASHACHRTLISSLGILYGWYGYTAIRKHGQWHGKWTSTDSTHNDKMMWLYMIIWVWLGFSDPQRKHIIPLRVLLRSVSNMNMGISCRHWSHDVSFTCLASIHVQQVSNRYGSHFEFSCFLDNYPAYKVFSQSFNRQNTVLILNASYLSTF